MSSRFFMPVMLSVAAFVSPALTQQVLAEEAACPPPAVRIEAEEFTPLTATITRPRRLSRFLPALIFRRSHKRLARAAWEC